MIHRIGTEFDVQKVQLATPSMLSGGSFFSKAVYQGVPLYVYTPKCYAKDVEVTSKRHYFDFICKDEAFIGWMEDLEDRLQALLYEKRDTWFIADSLELEDIQNNFIPLMKMKSSQRTLRAHVPQGKMAIKEPIQVYDEMEQAVALENIKETSQMISILEVSGVKFNQKCFQAVVNIRQMLILHQTPFAGRIIKPADKPVVEAVEEEAGDFLASKTDILEVDLQTPEDEDTLNIKTNR